MPSSRRIEPTGIRLRGVTRVQAGVPVGVRGFSVHMSNRSVRVNFECSNRRMSTWCTQIPLAMIKGSLVVYAFKLEAMDFMHSEDFYVRFWGKCRYSISTSALKSASNILGHGWTLKVSWQKKLHIYGWSFHFKWQLFTFLSLF